MISLLIAGKLVCRPQSRQSKNGNLYVAAQVLATTTNDETFLCSIVAFEEDICRRLLALDKGDSVCVTGNGKPTGWTGRDGAPTVGLSVTVNELLTAYALKRKRGDLSRNGESLLPAVSPISSTASSATGALNAPKIKQGNAYG